MKNIMHIGTLVGGLVMAAGLTMAIPASANHTTCNQVAKKFIDYVKRTNNVPPGLYSYGRKGEIAPDDYNNCVVANFEKNPDTAKYRIKVMKRVPEWENGTIYKSIKRGN